MARSTTVCLSLTVTSCGGEYDIEYAVSVCLVSHQPVYLPLFPSGGDESQVALAIIQTSSRDCGVYGCSIKNEFGTDSTDFLLSVDRK